MQVAPEDVKWLVYKHRQPAGTQCAECTQIVQAMPSESWSSVVARATTDQKFAEGLTLARKVLRGDRVQTWLPQTIDALQSVEVRVKRKLLFVTQSDAQAFFGGIDPARLGLSLESISDETGKPVQGYFFAPSDKPAYDIREVELSWKSSAQLSTSLLKPDKIIMASQGEETFGFASASLKKAPQKLLQISDLQAKVEEMKAAGGVCSGFFRTRCRDCTSGASGARWPRSL